MADLQNVAIFLFDYSDSLSTTVDEELFFSLNFGYYGCVIVLSESGGVKISHVIF